MYGKNVSDLQSNIVIGDDSISGTLNYVTGYTGFNGSETSEQSGNYIALKFTPKSWDGILTVELLNGSKGEVTLSEGDDFCVFRIANTDQSIQVNYINGDDELEKTYSLTNLVLTPAE